MNNIYFSVIVPTYNRADLLSRCIESVLRQTFKYFELIVVDNYSTDDTLDILNHYVSLDSRINFYQEYNHGIIAHSRNFGIKKAKGKYISFLDSDDWFHNDKLQQTYDILQKGYDLVFTAFQNVSHKGHIFTYNKGLKTNDIFYELLSRGNCICNSTVTVRRSSLFKVGLLSEDPQLRAVEDCDCWLKLALNGSTFFYIDKVLTYYWIGQNESATLQQIDQTNNLFSKYTPLLPIKRKKSVMKVKEYTLGKIFYNLGMYRHACHKFINAFPLPTLFMNMKLLISIIFSIIFKYVKQ